MQVAWLKLLDECDCIYIYGAGIIAKRIWELIKLQNKEQIVLGFLVSDTRCNPQEIEGIPILGVSEGNTDIDVFIAVTDIYQEEVQALLMQYGYARTVFVYKYSFLLGRKNEAADCNIRLMKTEELMAHQCRDGVLNRMDIIVRLLAVEESYSKNCVGFQLYRKMQDLRVSAGYGVWAEQRYRRLIESVRVNGYEYDSEIIIDCDLQLVDGAHRLALALFYNIPQVKVFVLGEAQRCDYGGDWFKERFEKEECEILEKRLQELKVERLLMFGG